MAVGLTALGVLLAVLVVLAWQRSAQALRVQTVSSSVLDDSRVSVTVAVTVDPRARVICEVHAKAADTTTVGSATLEFEPTQERRRSAAVVVPTRLPAVRGEAVSCRGVMT